MSEKGGQAGPGQMFLSLCLTAFQIGGRQKCEDLAAPCWGLVGVGGVGWACSGLLVPITSLEIGGRQVPDGSALACWGLERRRGDRRARSC